jgi:hypothetical protein
MHGIAEVSGLVKLCLKIKAYGPHGDGGQVNRKSASLPTWLSIFKWSPDSSR